MKNSFLQKSLLIGIFSPILLLSQNRLNDPSIVAQHKRMVFQSWGDFRPYPKYFLFIQTNFAYATVWGMWAPNRNQDYKNGPDIRPLKPNGEQNLRYAQLKLQEREAEKIKTTVDTLYKRNVQDFAHWTPAIVDADPLWLLYYKRMLKPIELFPDQPQNYIEWRLDNAQIYQNLSTTGTLKRLKEELDLIKEKYSLSRSMEMPRGKRFVMYHETLIKWRKFTSELKKHNDKTRLLFDYKNRLNNHSNQAIPNSFQPHSDQEIVHQIMEHYKNKY